MSLLAVLTAISIIFFLCGAIFWLNLLGGGINSHEKSPRPKPSWENCKNPHRDGENLLAWPWSATRDINTDINTELYQVQPGGTWSAWVKHGWFLGVGFQGNSCRDYPVLPWWITPLWLVKIIADIRYPPLRTDWLNDPRGTDYE